MTSRVLVLSVAATLAAALPAAAQKQGSVEVGGFLAYANADNSLTLGNTIAFGGRAGVHIIPVLSLEVDVARASGNGTTHTPIHVWLLYNAPAAGRTEFVLGVGFVRNTYSGAYEADDNGLSGAAGARYLLTDMVGLRLDGTVDFMANPSNKSHQVPFNGNWGLRVGVSALLNRARP